MDKLQFLKLLNFLDDKLTFEKREIAKRGQYSINYQVLIFEDYFQDSILSIDYLDIYDYFGTEYKMQYVDNIPLSVQYSEISPNKYLEIIESLYKILYLSHYKKDEININNILIKIKNFLLRLNINVQEIECNNVSITLDNKIGEGYYCNIYI